MEALHDTLTPAGHLAELAGRARDLYAARVANTSAAPEWWNAVVITASSQRQAERYRWEIDRREQAGRIPAGAMFVVIPDAGDRRIGSGAATFNALHTLLAATPRAGLAAWWSSHRVLLIHAGGDSRRLPQYSLSGKLFSAVPVTTPWGETSTVFDEILALSTAWVEHMPCGLVVGSGDVILTFDAASLAWDRPGVTGVAMLQPSETGTRHGVYITDGGGRIYSFLQKPSVAELTSAGGIIDGGRAAVDTGLLRFDPETAARLTVLGGIAHAEPAPPIDLYEHVTMALTGQWQPGPDESPALHALAAALQGLPFSCALVSGDFTHIGTTSLFRNLMTSRQPGMRSRGVVIDSVLGEGADLGPGAVVIECHCAGRVHAGAGSVLHGLDGIADAVHVPEDTVVHQLPVATANGVKGVVVRVYGVEDDPKTTAAGGATWLGRPLLEQLRSLGLDCEQVWPGMRPEEWTLWNAQLFPVGPVADSWGFAQWILQQRAASPDVRWAERERLSLAGSTQWADAAALDAASVRRSKATWRATAVSLVESGADIRPMLANAPGTGTLAETGRHLCARARDLETAEPTEAASRQYIASLFFGQAGLADAAGQSRTAAFRLVERAVRIGGCEEDFPAPISWQRDEVTVEAPARIDLGGGWSDTPPFCLDWGGTVVNVAAELDGRYPIRTSIRRIREPIVRCIADDAIAEYRTCAEALRPCGPGDPFAIPLTALRMARVFEPDRALAETLDHLGGGIEITTTVRLPMGSGLGTSSILAAATLRAILEISGSGIGDRALSEQVMRLEQRITTGGGWQDQIGGIHPGAKLAMSGPGLHQRVRVQPVQWDARRQAEFQDLVLLYYTGIPRLARDLLRQVVGRYLARETACLQVLHSIKTLAMEMSYAMQEGEWDHLGGLLDRHWRLNQQLDPNTTNAPIHALLESVRPFIRGAKLAGAGGGGFMILLARSPEARQDLERLLTQSGAPTGGAVHSWRIATEGLRLCGPLQAHGQSR